MSAQYYSTTFPFVNYPFSNEVYGIPREKFEKALDSLMLLTDLINENKTFKKPMNVLVAETNTEMILAINFDKATFGNTLLSTLVKIQQNNSNIEPRLRKILFEEEGLNANAFLYLPIDSFKKNVDYFVKVFDENESLENRMLKLRATEITPDLKVCVDAMLKHSKNTLLSYGGNGMWVQPIFKAKDLTIDQNMCFCVLPFNNDRLEIFDEIIKPTLEKKFGINVIRSGNIFKPNLNIMESIWTYINQAAFIIADLSDRNPNVFYELGICHTLGKPVVTLCDEKSYKDDYNEKLPFDINSINTIFYKNSAAGPQKLVEEIEKNVRALRSGKDYIE